MPKLRKKAQSLVEFALFLTLIFFLLAGAIDFGLAFFAYQGISGAAQEGSTYAAINPAGVSGYGEVRQRVVTEAGSDLNIPHRARFVNLFDLNSNKVPDNTESSDGKTIRENYIQISVVSSDLIDRNTRPAEWDAQTAQCQIAAVPQRCAMEVRVLFDYRAFFPAAKLFMGTGQIQLSATRRMTISR